MSLALYDEDPAPEPIVPEQVLRTLVAFRSDPIRGRAVILDADARSAGYAFLVSFWSNELGGEICTIDELYVQPAWRGRGFATALIAELQSGRLLRPTRPVALELEITPTNTRARALYERLGFSLKRNTTLRLAVPSSTR